VNISFFSTTSAGACGAKDNQFAGAKASTGGLKIVTRRRLRRSARRKATFPPLSKASPQALAGGCPQGKEELAQQGRCAWPPMFPGGFWPNSVATAIVDFRRTGALPDAAATMHFA